jgi:hypothetical protein
MNTVIEYGVIGFGLVGAVLAGNAVSKHVERNGGSKSDQLVLGCVASGLSVAVLPAAAIAGLCATARKGLDLYGSDRMKLNIAEAKAKTLGTMDKLANGRKPVRVAAKR